MTAYILSDSHIQLFPEYSWPIGVTAEKNDFGGAISSRLSDTITHVTVPFRYIAHRYDGAPVKGHLSIALPADMPKQYNQFDNVYIERAINNAVEQIKAQGGYNSLLFKLFVPFCTREFNCLAHNLMPCYQETKKSDSCDPLVMIIALIVDFATLAFRLLFLIPRAFYQSHCLNGPGHAPGIEIYQGMARINWEMGYLSINRPAFQYENGQSGNASIKNDIAEIYLG